MSTIAPEDRASLCSFTFVDGCRYRIPGRHGSCAHRNPRKPNPLYDLLHTSLDTRGVGYGSRISRAFLA
jgi:hypothetical protein